jgi:hypothetical protein
MSRSRPGYGRNFIRCASVFGAICLTSLSFSQTSRSQTKDASTPDAAFSEALKKYPGLLSELGQLFEKLKHNVQFPAERHQSELLPLLPASTTFYAAFPNYGEPAHQALMTFRDELKQSAVLQNWWQQSDMAKAGPQIESSIDKFYELSQYLGDEIVLAGEAEGSAPSVVFVAEVRKPGLKDFLQQVLKDLPDKSTSNVRVLDLQELATAKTEAKSEAKTMPGGLVILVRPEVVVAGSDLIVVRNINRLLEARTSTTQTTTQITTGEFTSTPFGQRLVRTYEGGASVVAAADLHKLISKLPAGKPDSQKMLERSGLKDVKYLVWDHKSVAGPNSEKEPLGEIELSFTGPRHGAASWLAAPAPLGSLDFVSPKSVLVGGVTLKNFGEIFDDLRAFSADSNPSAFATLPAMEQAMHVNLRDDLLSQLQGEIAFALTDFTPEHPEWKAILRVNDSDRLQKTLSKLLLSAPVVARQSEEEGVTYHSLMVPSSPKPLQVVYAFVDGYLIVASSHDSAAEAVQLHKSGESLAKSAKFLESFPPGYAREVSALVYEDASAMTAFRLRQLSPDMAQAISRLIPSTAPIVFGAYGEERSIHGFSAGGGADASAILFGAAIAIPNLLRAKTAANESAAVGTVRAINVAQTSYSYKYLQNGYARDLASLGPDPRGSGLKTANHAALIDADLGSSSCTAGAWCEKSGYRFSISGVCRLRSCNEFVIVATPVVSGPGSRNLCSTSDSIIRFQAGPPLITAISAQECREWTPLR